MIETVLKEINNYFIKTDGVITSMEIDGFNSINTFFVGQYVKIEGSTLNDGVYKIASKVGSKYTTLEALKVEDAVAYVYGLAIPMAVLDLSTKIASQSVGIKSESLGDYSVTYDDGWKNTYRNELAQWRQVYP